MEVHEFFIGLVFLTTAPFMLMPALLAIFNVNKNVGYIVVANGFIFGLIYFSVFDVIRNYGLLLAFPVIIVILILWLFCLKYSINEKP